MTARALTGLLVNYLIGSDACPPETSVLANSDEMVLFFLLSSRSRKHELPPDRI